MMNKGLNDIRKYVHLAVYKLSLKVRFFLSKDEVSRNLRVYRVSDKIVKMHWRK